MRKTKTTDSPWLPVPALALMKRQTILGLRQKRTFGYLAALLGVLFLMAWASMPRSMEMFNVQEAAQRSRDVFEVLSNVLLGAALFLMPGFAAVTLAAERSQERFDQLRLTLISPRGIILANIVNSLAFFLLLLTAAIPVISVAMFSIGVDYGEITRRMSLVGGGAVSGAAMGTLAGALFRRPIAAIIAAYVLMAPCVLNGTLAMPMLFQSVPGLLWPLVVTVGMLIAATALSVVLLRRLPAPRRVSSVKPVDDPDVLAQRRKTFPYYLIDPLRRYEPIADDANPVLVREIRTGLTTRTASAIRTGYISLTVSAVLLVLTIPPLFTSSLHILEGLLTAIPVVSWIAVTAVASGIFSQEHEQEGLDMLRMTPLQAPQFVAAKFVCAILAVIPILAGPMLMMLLMPIAGARAYLVVCTIAVVLVSSVLQSVSVCLLVSMSLRKTGAAFIVSVIGSALLFGWPLLFAIAADALGVSIPKSMTAFSTPLAYAGILPHDRNLSFPVSIVLSLFVAGILIALSIVRCESILRRED